MAQTKRSAGQSPSLQELKKLGKMYFGKPLGDGLQTLYLHDRVARRWIPILARTEDVDVIADIIDQIGIIGFRAGEQGRERKKRSAEKHRRWAQWFQEGKSYGQIQRCHFDETGEFVSPRAITQALKRGGYL